MRIPEHFLPEAFRCPAQFSYKFWSNYSISCAQALSKSVEWIRVREISCSEIRTTANIPCPFGWGKYSLPDTMQNLTHREFELARFAAAGFSNQQIAEILHIRRQTVKNHIQAVYRKLHIRNRVELCLRLRGDNVDEIQRVVVANQPSPKSDPALPFATC